MPGKASDFKIYEDELHTGRSEIIAQNVNAFGAASQNAISITPEIHRGQFSVKAFYDLVGSLVTRRDVTSTAAASDLILTQDEEIGVKIKRKIGPIAMTMDAFRQQFPDRPGKTAEDAHREFSFVLGQQIQQAVLVDYLNTAILSAEAALDDQAALNFDGTAATLTHAALNSGLSLFGDHAGRIVLFAMHSAPWFDLFGNAIGTNGFDGIATMAIKEGENATLGRATLVTDSPGLTTGAGSTLQYQILGLQVGAISIEESEPMVLESDTELGGENIVLRIQGEHSFTLRLMGTRWNISGGGANPTNAVLGTTGNWVKSVTEDKHLLGVHINVKG